MEMKTIKITYDNGNTLNQKVFDWCLKDGELFYTTRLEGQMAHPVVINAAHMVKIEEL